MQHCSRQLKVQSRARVGQPLPKDSLTAALGILGLSLLFREQMKDPMGISEIQ